MKAEWMKYQSNKGSYDRPCCPVCSEKYGPVPVVYKHSKYVCLNCCQVIDLDTKQQKWIDKYRRTRKRVKKCFMCGAYKMVMTQRRDPITHKWVNSSGKCSNCDCKMIV